MTRALVALVVCAVLSSGGMAAAKEGARAWLVSAIPRSAAPGTILHVSWVIRGDDGTSFNAIGMFVRFTSAAGGEPTEAFATATAHETGEYDADIAVPAGGIGRIEFGIAGTMSGPNIPSRRSDHIFPIANLRWTPTEAQPDGSPPPDRVAQLPAAITPAPVVSSPLPTPRAAAADTAALFLATGLGVLILAVGYRLRRPRPLA